jgi:hypothetical protein
VIIYKFTYTHPDLAHVVEWYGTKREAEAALMAFKEEEGTEQELAEIEKVDIPTDKKGLLAWLNLYFTSDNG